GIGENILEKIDNLGGWDFFANLKKEGKIRHAGFSFHDSPEVLDKILTKHPEAEFVQLQLNYFDWEDENVRSRGVYEVARRHNVPIIVMEPVKGGFLGNDKSVLSDVFKKYAPDKSVASWALKFLAEKEGILTILSGMSSLEQVQDNVKTFNGLTPLTDTERALIDDAAAALRAIPRVACTECRYCKDCPQKIHIPEMLGLYSDYLQCGVLSEHGYNMNAQFGAPATACVSCGLCEQHCPQHIEIRDYLGKIAELAKAFG
ncbi:MAG: aldo/keto reductase, partial [Oscillospiraceae bacterium]|nr:aldo/keto reductase [Oscillospiraceae bacterium]